ncbi:MAG: hypothetical protein AB9882_01315 [Ignavibacteriaceae bacterium]
MSNSLYRRIFDKPIPCPVCGCTFKWAINPAAGTLYCYNTNINDPEQMCEFEYRKEEVLTPEQILLFNRLLEITRLFTVV